MGELRPGPASLAGLEWLARVGTAPMDAWACAMGWGERVARSHANRLERAGWIERHPMIRGDGSLLITTRRGVRMTGLPVTPPPAPEPTYWAHDCASAWTAAWLTARGAKDWMGPREVLRDPELKRRVSWHTRVGFRTTGHRPDLLVHSAVGPIPIEVELQRKNNPRTEGILLMYYGWIMEGTITGVAYICATKMLADRLSEIARRVGIPARAWRTDLLDDVRQRALHAARERQPAQAAPAARED